MITNFISSQDSMKFVPSVQRVIIYNIKIMMGNETDEIIEEPFESLLQKYKEGLEGTMRGSNFVFDSIDL